MFDEPDDINEIFCYGTLLPGQERWQFLAPYVLAYEPDQVSGRVYDTGLGYPAALFDRVGVIHGFRFRLDPAQLREALLLLDEIEGAVDGLYHRVRVTTAMGVRAHAYQYGGTSEELVDIPEGNWLTR
tara:strand:+ start:4116 stop:4499 length:384 start_codon:yes stop_codon:yes gene_type:complete